MKHLITILMMLAASSVWADSDKSLQERFVQTTGIQEGDYKIVKGPSTCQEGNLRLLDIDNGSHLTLMLGAHPLVLYIGKPESTAVDRQCSTKTTTNFSANLVDSVRKETCRGEFTVYHVKVEPVTDGFRYTRKITSQGKVIREEACTLQKI